MREIIIINPTAGGGQKIIIKDEHLQDKNRTVHYTTAPGDCRRFVKDECSKDPYTHFSLYGGDGTLNEAVHGIMDAGAGKAATLTIHPCGSGNDTVKSLPRLSNGEVIPLDLIQINDSYGINMLNIGFDCNVVASAIKFKRIRLFKRSLSYILGIITEFFKPFGEDFTIEALCEDGSTYTYSGSCLLCSVCNGQWCGGGFHNSPASDMSDGVLEMLLVKKTGRLNFIKLIGKYKDGTLLDPETGAPPKGYEDLVIYRRITRMTISGTKMICSDGELIPTASGTVSVLPGAIQYRM